MKYISISEDDTLVSLIQKVGINNIDQLLADNGLTRCPNIGEVWANKVRSTQATASNVDVSNKINILNSLIPNSDIYEMAALAGADTWKILETLNAFPSYLYVSDLIETSIPESNNLLGNGISVDPSVYEAVNFQLLQDGTVDDAIFNNYRSDRIPTILSPNNRKNGSNPLSWFRIPQDDIILYSSIGGSISIPAFPQEISDTRTANYGTMPDIIYQYEPWQLYNSSGPKMETYSFELHRDMWTGNHNDGKANELIRFCQAQCYPVYAGASVITPIVSLYISGGCVISGVMNNVDVKWDGPIGSDGWYLNLNLSFTITEVSQSALNYGSVSSKGLIG